MRLLAVGASPEVAAERISHSLRHDATFSSGDVRDVVADAAAITRQCSLRPAAEAAFVDDFQALLAHAALTRDRGLNPAVADAAARSDIRRRPSAADLADLRGLSLRLLDAFLANDRESPDFPRPEEEDSHGVALRYVEGLLRQEEIVEALGAVDSENATLHAALSGSERKSVDDFLLYRGMRGRFHTVDSLVEEWWRLGTALETDSYSILYEEYTDWLKVRTHLGAVLLLLRPGGHPELESRVRQLDEAFLAVTYPVAGTLLPGSPWRMSEWWWSRAPLDLGKEFRDRLADVGAELEPDVDAHQ